MAGSLSKFDSRVGWNLLISASNPRLATRRSVKHSFAYKAFYLARATSTTLAQDERLVLEHPKRRAGFLRSRHQ